ncbi:organic hydroperoxide resistance protein [Nocardioides jejuensis]|uniref:Organic hydroperoxide resistance protein n=1 Tax=Nocardioides jejuensis TaxID=2502782 RepID=A0A4R1C270_9ACTN|nr:organic hydroperoxide resistance protein [Nocardioides jejuensis]TCJ24118.1 organic hydroperoxide resistance protein [Nocardioides jejuensis]
MTALYTATAVSTGDARNGHVSSTDGLLDLDVRMPKELGGAGGATNPEQLFAAGYAACFHSALKLVGGKAQADLSDTEVVADVSLHADDLGFALSVQLEVTIPNVDAGTAQKLVDAAHQVCPYSRATRGNVEVTLTVA